MSVKWWNRLTFMPTRKFEQFYPNFWKLWRPYGTQDFRIGDRRFEIFVRFYGATLWLSFEKQGEKLILQESVWIHNIFSGLCLRNYYIWVYLRFELNIYFIWEWISYTNCGFIEHMGQIYNFWTDLHVVNTDLQLNRSTSWLQILHFYRDFVN